MSTKTGVAEIAAFQQARLDEDEAAAKAGTRRIGMRWRLDPEPWDGDTGIVDDLGRVGSTGGLYAAGHIIRHDPARVLRDVEAGRARLVLMIEATAEMDRLLADESAAVAEQAMAIGRARAATVAVKWDAMVHIAHPDYMPEWKP